MKRNTRAVLKTAILAALLAASLPAFATDYFVVVPVKGKTTSESTIRVDLAAASLPSAELSTAYSYNFSPNLSVTGDPKFTGTGITWAVSQGSLPAGLALDSASGVLSGTPTTLGSSSFTVTANYKSKSGAQSYQLAVSSAKDPYYANVLELLQFDGAVGSNALVPDKGTTFSGSATVTGAPYAWVGTGSMKLTESTNLVIPGTAAWQFSGDFTIEYWFMPTALPSTGGVLMMKERSGTYPPYGSTVDAADASTVVLQTYFGTGANASTAGLGLLRSYLPLNQWTHIVQENIGGEHRVYVNGQLVGNGGTQYDSVTDGTITIARGVTGYMDALRVTAGVGRYGSNFTPTRTPYPTH